MSIKRLFHLSFVAIFWSSAALAQFNGCGPGLCNLTTTVSPPATTGSALLVNNSDFALLVDSTSTACLAGGC